MKEQIARLYRFVGTVQGVGFRRTAESIASSFQVTGYVMNLADGRVELHVEGTRTQIDAYIQKVSERFAENILNFSQELVEPLQFNNFGISFEKARRKEM